MIKKGCNVFYLTRLPSAKVGCPTKKSLKRSLRKKQNSDLLFYAMFTLGRPCCELLLSKISSESEHFLRQENNGNSSFNVFAKLGETICWADLILIKIIRFPFVFLGN